MKLEGATVYRGGNTSKKLRPEGATDVGWSITKSPSDRWPVVTLSFTLDVPGGKTKVDIDLNHKAQAGLIDVIKMHGEDVMDYILGDKEKIEVDR